MKKQCFPNRPAQEARGLELIKSLLFVSSEDQETGPDRKNKPEKQEVDLAYLVLESIQVPKTAQHRATSGLITTLSRKKK